MRKLSPDQVRSIIQKEKATITPIDPEEMVMWKRDGLCIDGLHKGSSVLVYASPEGWRVDAGAFSGMTVEDNRREVENQYWTNEADRAPYEAIVAIIDAHMTTHPYSIQEAQKIKAEWLEAIKS